MQVMGAAVPGTVSGACSLHSAPRCSGHAACDWTSCGQRCTGSRQGPIISDAAAWHARRRHGRRHGSCSSQVQRWEQRSSGSSRWCSCRPGWHVKNQGGSRPCVASVMYCEVVSNLSSLRMQVCALMLLLTVGSVWARLIMLCRPLPRPAPDLWRRAAGGCSERSRPSTRRTAGWRRLTSSWRRSVTLRLPWWDRAAATTSQVAPPLCSAYTGIYAHL